MYNEVYTAIHFIYNTEYRRQVWGIFLASIHVKVFEDNALDNFDNFFFQFRLQIFEEYFQIKIWYSFGVKIYYITVNNF